MARQSSYITRWSSTHPNSQPPPTLNTNSRSKCQMITQNRYTKQPATSKQSHQSQHTPSPSEPTQDKSQMWKYRCQFQNTTAALARQRSHISCPAGRMTVSVLRTLGNHSIKFWRWGSNVNHHKMLTVRGALCTMCWFMISTIRPCSLSISLKYKYILFLLSPMLHPPLPPEKPPQAGNTWCS